LKYLLLAYGLPKVHKSDCPFRVILSSINNPLHKLAGFLQKILHDSIPIVTIKINSYIKNSFDFVGATGRSTMELDYPCNRLSIRDRTGAAGSTIESLVSIITVMALDEKLLYRHN